ncbi:exodeoxyribonuclease VII small subunit [Papillibacter cinnamivorans]|uniref:Exodeoxyribonuclease 7 small subunit n=1 Tax=Papillibacter cinnamivorans DSM 12816 TaxID=1122930 RepID=A0A1W2CLH3_9FIRM|nr:exodeoxyribonuclease VII small subunit [Papillibacter cinnamivorans]SMC85498.1 Exodeoxyribonuclease VII small subunit [Papillibacter cinnamivorans DSM 12816]
MAEKKLSFEDSITRLEQIVKLLEKGDARLEDSLALFEEGTGLLRRCGTMLDNAEQKVVRLMKSADGTPAETEFPKESV